LYVNYIPTVTSTQSSINSNIAIIAYWNGGYAQWIRTRMPPPNGVQPTISFGSVENS